MYLTISVHFPYSFGVCEYLHGHMGKISSHTITFPISKDMCVEQFFKIKWTHCDGIVSWCLVDEYFFLQALIWRFRDRYYHPWLYRDLSFQKYICKADDTYGISYLTFLCTSLAFFVPPNWFMSTATTEYLNIIFMFNKFSKYLLYILSAVGNLIQWLRFLNWLF